MMAVPIAWEKRASKMGRTRFACMPYGFQPAVHNTGAAKLPEARVEEEPEAVSFIDMVSNFAMRSGAADAWKAWMDYTTKYCKCVG